MINKCCLVFPNQLFKYINLINTNNHIFLVEEYLFFKQYKFHKQKISFHRSTMKFYEDYLKSQGIRVSYINSNDNESNILNLLDMLKSQGINLIEMYDPVDYLLNKRINKKCNEHNIDLLVHESPHFLNTNEDLEDFFKESKKSFSKLLFINLKEKKEIYLLILTEDQRVVSGHMIY